MLTHMLVQYLVGLCCQRTNPNAVQIELGDLVLDDVLDKKRDVDVTVTIRDDNGEGWAFKAFEVKDERSPLDVTVIEQLCAKLNDMKSFTHRAIVSSSGYSDSAKRKAEHRGITLYTLERWSTPIEFDFPMFGLKGMPEDAFPFSRKLLTWPNAQVRAIIPTAMENNFNIENIEPVLDAKGTVHHKYRTFEEYRDELLLRSTEILFPLEPAQTMMHALPEFHSNGFAITSEWPHTHTLDVSSDNVYLKLGKIETVTITGFMHWERKREVPDFRVMRQVGDEKPFAGALIALGNREGQMIAFVISDDRTMGIHIVQLEEKHRNMIRQLSLLPAPADSDSD